MAKKREKSSLDPKKRKKPKEKPKETNVRKLNRERSLPKAPRKSRSPKSPVHIPKEPKSLAKGSHTVSSAVDKYQKRSGELGKKSVSEGQSLKKRKTSQLLPPPTAKKDEMQNIERPEQKTMEKAKRKEKNVRKLIRERNRPQTRLRSRADASARCYTCNAQFQPEDSEFGRVSKHPVYCTPDCLLKQVEKARENMSDPNERVMVIEKCTNKVLSGVAGPPQEFLEQFLRIHPSFFPVLPQKSTQKVAKEAESRNTELLRNPRCPPPGQLRDDVRKKIKETLWQLAKERKDLLLAEKDIQAISIRVEEELFQHANRRTDVPQYNRWFRSFLLSLKMNEGLAVRILTGDLSPRKLVTMRPGELVSKDWSRGAILLHEPAPDQRLSSRAATATAAKQKVVQTTVQGTGDVTGNVIVPTDSTSRHRSHHFDVNCRICTGKEESEQQKVEEAKEQRRQKKSDWNEAQERARREKRLLDEQMLLKKDFPGPAKCPTFQSVTMMDSATGRQPMWSGLVTTSNHRFSSTAVLISGELERIKGHLPSALHVVGRIPPRDVWEYVVDFRSHRPKDVVLAELTEPQDPEHQLHYRGLYENMVEKSRFCVVGNCQTDYIKNFYMFPCPATEPIPIANLPFSGPGLEVERKDVILAIIVLKRMQKMPAGGQEAKQKQERRRPTLPSVEVLRHGPK